MYEVIDDGTKHIMDLTVITCSCNHFQVDGIPCPYALEVIGEKGDLPYNCCSQYNTKVAYVDTYACDIVPLGYREHWSRVGDVSHDHNLPPNSKRPAGQPRNSRRRIRLETINLTMCGRCGGKGHNKRSCKQPLPMCGVRKRKRSS